MVEPIVEARPKAVTGMALSASERPDVDIERALSDVLSGLVGADRVAPDKHFFDDLNADSLTMAHFCARVRKHPDLPAVSMRDIYAHPTISQLATSLAPSDVAPAEQPAAPPPLEESASATTAQYVICGALQLLCFLVYVQVASLVVMDGYTWITAGGDLLHMYLRSVAFGGGVALGVCALPIVAKWLLIGRWQPQQIPVWSMSYLRFWLVKSLIRSSPLVLLVGSPIYVLYLRALGARIGRGVAIFSVHVPVCTDMLTIGDGAVIRKDSFFTGYRARAGVIETGPVTLGRDVLVSEATVLDIDTSMADRAQLGHASSLHAGQAVPEGESWHGSPAQRTSTDFRAVADVRCTTLRRVTYAASQVVSALLLIAPLTVGGVAMIVAELPRLSTLSSTPDELVPDWPVWQILVGYLAIYVAAGLLRLAFVLTVPRLLGKTIRPDRVYPLYGFHYSVHRTITRLTNARFYNELFGNSSYVLHYLGALGYRVSRAEQTGSNFGTEVKHETPYLATIGRGTMVADGLSIANAEYSSTSFRVSRTTIGPHNFLGNRISYPARGRTGDNCLLATKVMVPIEGEVRRDVGLLGSPSFEIPRSVDRDLDRQLDADERQRRLRAKNAYNLRTMALFVLSHWLHVVGLAAIVVATDLYNRFGVEAVAAEVLLAMAFSMVYFALLERLVSRFRRLEPRVCSIYDPYFWWHERFWKFEMSARLVTLLAGTPYKNLLSRLLGVRLGKRVFDDDCSMPERTLVTIGDDCTLNAGSVLQSHSQEDGAFKSDHVVLGRGCTVGTNSLVHYGVTMGDHAVIAPDSFLMKGEEVPTRTFWGGNPAREGGVIDVRAIGAGHHRQPRALTSGPPTTSERSGR